MRLSYLPRLALVSATVLAGCASQSPIGPRTDAPPPAWASNVIAALAMLYPPAQTKLYVAEAPPGVVDVLRVTGYGVADAKSAGPAPRDGYRLALQTRDLGDGSLAVIAHVGEQTLSRVYRDGEGISGWSFDMTGADEAMKARVALIQYPPPRLVLPLSPQPEAARP